VWRHRTVSLNNEKFCCEISEDKVAFCEKTAGLRRGKFSNSNSACLKVSVPVKIFQFQDMLNESERYQDAANGLEVDIISGKICDACFRFNRTHQNRIVHKLFLSCEY
jgi:hypothetical protein